MNAHDAPCHVTKLSSWSGNVLRIRYGAATQLILKTGTNNECQNHHAVSSSWLSLPFSQPAKPKRQLAPATTTAVSKKSATKATAILMNTPPGTTTTVKSVSPTHTPSAPTVSLTGMTAVASSKASGKNVKTPPVKEASALNRPARMPLKMAKKRMLIVVAPAEDAEQG